MWQTFITAYQQALCAPDALFSRLRNARIEVVSVEHGQQIIHALTLLTKSQQQGLFYLPFHEALREARENMASQSLAETLRSLKQIVKIGHAGKTNYRYYQQLQSPEFWSGQFDAVRQDRTAYHKMIKLHGQWLKENRYGGYSTQGLLWVYHTVLPVFQAWLDYANQELTLKKTQLDFRLAKQYQRFIKRLDFELKTEKQRIREALYQRLRRGFAFHLSGVEYGVSAFIQQMMQIKEKRMDEKETLSRQNIPTPTSSFATQKTRHLIEKEGSTAEKIALYTNSDLYPDLSVSANNHFEITDPHQAYRRSHEGYIYFVPETLTSQIPLKPPFYLRFLPTWLHFLFWGEQITYSFFQDAATEEVIRKERVSHSFHSWCFDPRLPFDKLTTDPAWIAFTTFFEELQQETKHLESAISQLSPLFNWVSYRILQGYADWLQATRKKALSQQIEQLTHYLKYQQIGSMKYAEVEKLVSQLDTANRTDQTRLFLEIAILRLQAIQHLPIPSTTISNPIFDQMHQAVSQIIATYEGEIMLMSEAGKNLFKALKLHLQCSEKTREPLELYITLQEYSPLFVECHSHWFRKTPEQCLAIALDNLLSQPLYSQSRLYGNQLARYRSTLSRFEEAIQINEGSPAIVIESGSNVSIPEERQPFTSNPFFSGETSQPKSTASFSTLIHEL